MKKLSAFDARWFMEAVDRGLVNENDGFFLAPRSKAKEQLFWTGPSPHFSPGPFVKITRGLIVLPRAGSAAGRDGCAPRFGGFGVGVG
jgi:hypothetical protein